VKYLILTVLFAVTLVITPTLARAEDDPGVTPPGQKWREEAQELREDIKNERKDLREENRDARVTLIQENKTERYLIGRDEIELLKNQLAVEYSVPPDVIFKGMVRFYFLKEDAFLSFPEWLKIHHAELAKKAKNIDSI
jgi:hypothetical protein